MNNHNQQCKYKKEKILLCTTLTIAIFLGKITFISTRIPQNRTTRKRQIPIPSTMTGTLKSILLWHLTCLIQRYIYVQHICTLNLTL